MADGVNPGVETGENPFAGIDPKLNVFALANGMDLSKGPGYRRLEWFTEGLERGILIEPDAGAFRLEVLSWPTGSAEMVGRSEFAVGLAADEVPRRLDAAIEAANGL